MLRSIKLLCLRNSEFIQFFTDLISIFSRHNPDELGIENQLNPVADELEKMKDIHGTDRGSEISNELKILDDHRDESITGILKVVEGFMLHYDEAIREAAELLLNKIHNFGPSIARQNYPTETASINGIIDSFNTESKLKEALKLLKLVSWAKKLDSQNQLFNKRYIDRIDESAKQSDDKIKELRSTTTENYYILRDHLNAHATLNAEGGYIPLIDQLNELTDEYNLLINRRIGTNADDAETGTDTDTED